MDESSANAYYDAQRTKGLGAAKFKRGLGYTPPEDIPSARSLPPTPLPTPYMMPGAQPTAVPSGTTPRPSGVPLTPTASSQLPSASAWTAHRSGDAIYYYNTFTSVSQWDRPTEFVGDVISPDATPKPISSERIQNTKWTEVKCEDGRVYYFNPETKATSWTVPDEVLKLRHPSLSAVLRPGSIPSLTVKKPEALPEIKKGRRATPREILAFKNLLEDSEVTAFSRYEMEATRLEDDPRWQGVSLEKERRVLFADHCTRCARQQRSIKPKSVGQPTSSVDRSETSGMITSEADGDDHPSEAEKFEPSTVQYPEESILKHHSHDFPSDVHSKDRRIGSEEEKQKRAREEQEVVDSRRRLRRATKEAAFSDFRTLLSEIVKQPTIFWESARHRLEADIQGRGTHPMMEDADRERLFYDHVDRTHDGAVRDYLQLVRDRLGQPPEEAAEKVEGCRVSPWESFEEAERQLQDVFLAVQPTEEARRRIWQLHTASWRKDTVETLGEIIQSCRPSRSRPRERRS